MRSGEGNRRGGRLPSPRSPGGAPILDPASSGSSRRIAGLALSLAAAGLVVLVLRSWEERARRARYRPPFSAEGAEAVAADGSVWRADETLLRPTVILYVRWSCPYCARELQRWAALRSEELPGPGIDLWVVAPEPLPASGSIPEPLRQRVLLDRGGSTGRALGADLVPTTAYLAPGGTVHVLTRGQTSVDRIRASIAHLHQEASIDAPVR